MALRFRILSWALIFYSSINSKPISKYQPNCGVSFLVVVVDNVTVTHFDTNVAVTRNTTPHNLSSANHFLMSLQIPGLVTLSLVISTSVKHF